LQQFDLIERRVLKLVDQQMLQTFALMQHQLRRNVDTVEQTPCRRRDRDVIGTTGRREMAHELDGGMPQ
jgi:hypothetical protein